LVSGLAMHGDQSVLQAQIFPRQTAVIKPPRLPTGYLQSGGHRQESQPLLACRFGAITGAKHLCAPKPLDPRPGQGASRRRAGVSEEGGLGCEIADTFHEGDARADVSTARLSAA
jgi:hypothetical protein